MQTYWYTTRDTVVVAAHPGDYGRYAGCLEMSRAELKLIREIVEEHLRSEAFGRPLGPATSRTAPHS